MTFIDIDCFIFIIPPHVSELIPIQYIVHFMTSSSLSLQAYRIKNTHKSRNDSSGSLCPQPEPYLRPDPSAQRNSRASDTSSAYSGSDNFGGDDAQFSDDDMDASSLEVRTCISEEFVFIPCL